MRNHNTTFRLTFCLGPLLFTAVKRDVDAKPQVITLRRFSHFALLLVACVILSFGCQCLSADESSAADELRQLGLEYDRLCRANLTDSPNEQPEYTNEMTDEAFLEQYDISRSELNAENLMVPRFLAYAKTHIDLPLAFDAIAFVIQQGGPATGALNAPPWECKEQAIDIVKTHYMNEPRVVYLFDQLSESIASEKTETLLRAGLQDDCAPHTRAAAGLALAKYLHNYDQCRRRSFRLKDKVRIDSFFDRHWKLVITPHLEKLAYDRDTVTDEVKMLLNQVATKYSDLEVPEFRSPGLGNVFLQSVSPKQPRTYGDLAHSLEIKWAELGPGNKAPEIVGQDSDLQQFRLSDYKGKVVLLTFSANWCAPCKRLYPVYNAVAEKFDKDQFVMLSVSRDESIETLKSSIASREITWRCWWDGKDGPITNAWKIGGVPAIFLLDHEHVIQEVNFHQGSSPEDFGDAISLLLSKVPEE